jgi:hypothetical protein
MKRPNDNDDDREALDIMEISKRMCRECMAKEPGFAPEPSFRMDPLTPPLSFEEYEELERDR